jgi:hypothetical protein
MMERRQMIARLGSVLASLGLSGRVLGRTSRQSFPVERFGAKGDGVTRDTAAIQRAIDAAAKVGGRVILRSIRRYLTGTLNLRGGIDFHLTGSSRLIVSSNPDDYISDSASTLQAAGIATTGALLTAKGAHGLSISGSGTIDGRSTAFMERYDPTDEWWIPKPFRPRLLVLEDCEGLTITGVTFHDAPSWTVHLLGCRKVLIDGITISNRPDVPNCDGIDPDHCQNVEIRNCRITCGDDAVVIKTTAGHDQYGPSHHIHVHDCVLETQDSGLKIGTETYQDIHDILFERCTIVKSCRGIGIQLRDSGTVRDIIFRDIRFKSQYFSAPWWGRGEAISFTAIPRNAQTQVGSLRNVLVQNVRGQAENSIRIEALGGARISDITLDGVAVTISRHTAYPGNVFDNRPTSVADPLENRGTPGISIRHADRVTIRNSSVAWGANPPESFTNLLRAEDAPGLDMSGLSGDSAHPGKVPARDIR